MDEFCKLILEAADQAAEYWITRKPSKLAKLAPEAKAKMALAETKLEGYQLKLNLFQVLIRERSLKAKHEQIITRVADFLDAMTGGDFGAEVRHEDPARARAVYVSATELVATLRSTKPRYTFVEMLPSFLMLILFAYLVVQSFGADMWRVISKLLSAGLRTLFPI